MGSAESVHDKHIAQCGHLPRELGVVGLFADFKANVLAEYELAGIHLDAVEPRILE